jgi:hypothetical protein
MNITITKEEAELLLNLITEADMDDKNDILESYTCTKKLANKLLSIYREEQS